MKRLIPLLAVFLCIAATPMFALDNAAPRDDRAGARERDRTTLIDDVIRMSNAGVSEDSIVKFIRQSHDRYVMNADTIIQLTDAKVSKGVIDVLLDNADDRGRDDGSTRTVERRSTVYLGAYAPYYGYGYGYGLYADPWFYDPYWYGPRFGVSIGFGRSWGGYVGHYRGWGGRRHR